MKHYLFYILLLTCNCMHITAVDSNNQKDMFTNKNSEKSLSFYASYFIFKEFLKMNFHDFFIDHKKIKQASIHCCKAHHESDAHWLWIDLILKFKQDPIIELKNHIYNDSVEELAAYILQKHQELKLYCVYCGEYSGYYISKSEQP